MIVGGLNMAIWQFQCNIIPARLNFDRLSHDEMISWKGIPLPPHNLKFLEQEDSWSKDIIQMENTMKRV